MSYSFEWNPAKAASNLRKHDVSFEEAVTVFADPLSLNIPDPLHSEEEQRFLVLEMSTGTVSLLSLTRSATTELESSAFDKLQGANVMTTKTGKTKSKPDADRDTLQPEYDFSKGMRGATARRFAEGANLVVIDPDLHELFPTSEAVNEALRGLAKIATRASSTKPKKRSA